MEIFVSMVGVAQYILAGLRGVSQSQPLLSVVYILYS